MQWYKFHLAPSPYLRYRGHGELDGKAIIAITQVILFDIDEALVLQFGAAVAGHKTIHDGRGGRCWLFPDDGLCPRNQGRVNGVADSCSS